MLGAGLSYLGKTYAGHVFRVRSYHDVLLAEETVPPGGGTVDVHVRQLRHYYDSSLWSTSCGVTGGGRWERGSGGGR